MVTGSSSPSQHSGSEVKLRPGTLYGALDRLADQGLIAVDREEAVDGRVGAPLFFALQQALSAQGTTYLIVLGLAGIAVTVLAPRGIWGSTIGRTDFRLFPVGHRLELSGTSPDADLAHRGPPAMNRYNVKSYHSTTVDSAVTAIDARVVPA